MDQKHKAMKKVKRSEDRISGLPDTVIGHILSYLTTPELVQTRLLSKRWLSAWSYVPVLCMNDSYLFFDDTDKELAIHSSFIQFLNNSFNMCKLQKLTLKCRMFDCYRVNEWVMSAMRCGVKELDLCASVDGFKLGVPLFVYQELVALKLGKDFVLDIPGEVLLPSLKKLHLDSVTFSDDESCHKLLSGCPVLEYLNMDGCYMGKGKTCQIISSTLKFLSLKYGYDFLVVVDAPCLEVLRCSCMPERSSFKNLGSLNEAYIDVRMFYRTSDKIENFLQLVNIIANAKIITFTRSTLAVLSSLDLTTFPMFNGLTKLVLEGQCYYGMLLPKFLESAPLLQDLVLEPGRNQHMSFELEWHDPIQVPRCLLNSLKSVNIWEFNGKSSNVRKVLKYLVSNAKVLVKLSAGDQNKELKVSKRLINLLLENNHFPTIEVLGSFCCSLLLI